MFRAFEFLFWIAVLSVLIIAVVWFYGENAQFRDFLNTIWDNFTSNFKNKVGM